MIPVFDLQTAALEPGATLLEASAGTGKTYTLAGIYFRLIAEHDLAPGQILVSTYTEAATAELRSRIRDLLHEAWIATETGKSESDFLRDWLSRKRVPLETARARLARALRSFDEAAIHTIHGFCRRMLEDRAFESGLVFTAELIHDQEPLLRELAEDYWRAHFQCGDPVIAALALAGKLDAESLASLLDRVVSHPFLRVLPEAGALKSTLAEIAALFAELRAGWAKWREEIRALFLAKSDWAKPTIQSSVNSALPLLDELLADPAAPLEDYEALDAFNPESLKEGTRKNKVAPPHPFFDVCARIPAARHALKIGIQSDFLAWARDELPRRKAQRNVITFDDLLTRLYAALHSASGDALVRIIRGKFRAALIDEFQDTDGIQDAIFRKLFRDGTCWLYLIGDPKQAIYGFRGADVFTYLDSAVGAQPHQLGTNYRSTTPLVAAVNAIYNQGSRPFVLDQITFTPVKAAGLADPAALVSERKPAIPFQIWAWQDEKRLTSTKANAVLPRVVAAESSRMLAGSFQRSGTPLKPSNMAVLVSWNSQARLIQAALNDAGIPNVLLTDESAFHSAEARELHTVLAGLAEPSRENYLLAALATESFGFTASRIETLQRDESKWEDWLLRFQSYHALWRDRGFIQMFRCLLQQERIRSQILEFGDGERRLTNLLHLGELLHQEATGRHLGPAALLAWFAAQRQTSRPTGDNHELRLERDEDALQIVTIHKSKGLEYDVVFCPFSWGKADLNDDQPVFFHPQGRERRLCLDLGSDQYEENKATAIRERLAEQTRLLYVALTRARLRTHFVWGQFNECEISAANWILHPNHAADDLGTMKANQNALSPEAWRSELKALAATAPEALEIVDLPSETGPLYEFSQAQPEAFAAREFRGWIARDWRISSFSSLTLERNDEQPDHDPQVFDPAPAEAAIEEEGIHAFPRGKKAGSCLHEIFEQIDFSQPGGIEYVVSWKLAAFGFPRQEWLAPVTSCVRNTLTAELEPGFALESIDPASRLVELEFYLPANQLTSEELLRTLGPDAAAGLQFEPRRGMLKGFIDLVVMREGRFFILDWKSNHLGPHAESYAPEALAAAMRQRHYALQYCLYTLALHRYLSLRLPDYDYDTHFGGVFYVFLRGVDPAQPRSGIFYARPPRESIEELSLSLSKGI